MLAHKINDFILFPVICCSVSILKIGGYTISRKESGSYFYRTSKYFSRFINCDKLFWLHTLFNILIDLFISLCFNMDVAGVLKDLNLDEGEVPVYKYVDVFKVSTKYKE